MEIEQTPNIMATIEMSAKAMSMIMCELWDEENESIYPTNSVRMAVDRIVNICFGGGCEDAKKWMVYVKLIASYKYFHSDLSDEYNVKHYKYLHPIVNFLFMLVNVIDMEKVKAHYMEEMERIVGVIPEGAYIQRCNTIKKVIDLFDNIQKYYKNGLCIIATAVISKEDNDVKILEIYFGKKSDISLAP